MSCVCKELSPDAFDAYAVAHPRGSWLQTAAKAQHDRLTGAEAYTVGLYENDQLIGAARITSLPSRLGRYATCFGGPLFNDDLSKDQLRAAFEALAQWAARKHVSHIRIAPPVPYRTLDDHGRPFEGSTSAVPAPCDQMCCTPHDEALALYASLLHNFTGPRVGYSNELPWHFKKRLEGLSTPQDLLNSYTKSKRRDVKIAQSMHVKLMRLDESGLPRFLAQYALAREKHEFSDHRPLSYFVNLMRAFGDSCEFMLAYLDIPEFLEDWESKLEALEAKRKRLLERQATLDKPERLDGQLRDTIEKLNGAKTHVDEARHLLEKHGEVLDLAASIFIYTPQESVYFLSGSDPAYAWLYGQALLQHYVMCEDLKRGIPVHNFYGFSGHFDKDDTGAGVLEFKQGFCGYTVQLVGAGDLIGSRWRYKLKSLLSRRS